PEPENVNVDGMLRGAYCYLSAPEGDGPTARVLASGVAVPWAVRARDMLFENYGVRIELWSMTSWNELAREAVDIEQHNFNHPDQQPLVPDISQILPADDIDNLADPDFHRAVPDQIARWVLVHWQSLGTDGVRLSDTRDAARWFCRVDAESITVSVLQSLAHQGLVDPKIVADACTTLQIDDPTAVSQRPSPGTDG